MSFEFKDRASARPNRYKVTPTSGSPYYVTLERADEPTDVGTPLNAATMNAVMGLINSKVSVVKLWENTKPTNNFGAQTISLDLSDCQMVAINCRFNAEYAHKKMHFGVVGSQIGMDVISSSGYRGLRKATVSTTGISFEAATYNDNPGVVGYIIPTEIYGIKGVL